jgi:hypothetical protein
MKQKSASEISARNTAKRLELKLNVHNKKDEHVVVIFGIGDCWHLLGWGQVSAYLNGFSQGCQRTIAAAIARKS